MSAAAGRHDRSGLGKDEMARGPEHYLLLSAKLAGVLKTEAFNIRVIP